MFKEQLLHYSSGNKPATTKTYQEDSNQMDS